MLRSLLLIAALCTEVSALRLPVVVSRRTAFVCVIPVFATPLTAKADEVLHIFDYPKPGACGEALIPDKAVPFVKAFGGFSGGSCASAGFGTKDGTANGTGDKDKDREYDVYVK